MPESNRLHSVVPIEIHDQVIGALRVYTALEKMVRKRTVKLEDAVRKLENKIAECRSAQTQLLQLSRVFRDAADAIIIEMNREAEQSCGWSRKELIGKSIKNLLLLELQLRDSQRRLKEFSRKSIEALEADRKAVSQELHDSIGGNLAVIKFALESIVTKIGERPDAATISL